MNFKTISRNVGMALLVDALFMLISVFVSMSCGRDGGLYPLAISFVLTFSAGIFPFIFVRKTSRITLKEGYLIVVTSWLLSFIFGMLPYVLYGEPFSLEDAWFESVSGFTATGATILSDVESLPDSLLFWRSSTHFIGGLGVVVFLLLIIPDSSPIRMRLTNMELSSLSKDGYNSRTNRTVFIFAYVYIAIMVAAALAYRMAGMSPFDAINHAFSVCATGGFSTKNLSIAAFDSRLIEGLTMVFMLLSSIHFGLLYLVFATRSLKPLGNPVLRFYLCMLAMVTVVVALHLKVTGTEESLSHALWCGMFQTISTASTTGFAVADNSVWPMFANVIVMFATITCGCAGSTTGGLKCDRVMMMFKAIAVRIRYTINPSVIRSVKLGNRYVRDDEVGIHVLYIALFVFAMCVSVALSLLTGADTVVAFSGSLSSLTNVGPAIGEIGSLGNYGAIPSASKVLFTLDMFLGRVEIYPVLAVLGMMFSRNRR